MTLFNDPKLGIILLGVLILSNFIINSSSPDDFSTEITIPLPKTLWLTTSEGLNKALFWSLFWKLIFLSKISKRFLTEVRVCFEKFLESRKDFSSAILSGISEINWEDIYHWADCQSVATLSSQGIG